MNHICVSGKMQKAEEPALLVSNRGYRYGDGLFETMKICKGRLLLKEFHFERLFHSLSLLQYDIPSLFTAQKLEKEIMDLCNKNSCVPLGRVRLSVFRGNGGLYDGTRTPEYVIECWPLDDAVNQLNENGLVIDIYPEARKACDIYSNIKSASFLPYSMAALYAKENKLNDCLVLNSKGTIADSTIANLFLIRNDRVVTPALPEGCIDGVMRKYLLGELKNAGFKIEETVIDETGLEKANEVVLTNAIKGIRWVKGFRDKLYGSMITTEIYNRFIKTLFA